MNSVEYLIEDLSQLRIWEHLENLPYEPVVEHFDFTTIDLTKETPIYGKGGVKEMCTYTFDNEVVVRKMFVWNDDGVDIVIEWLSLDGNTGIRKTVFKPLNIVEMFKIKKANRDRTITYLEASAIGTPIEDYVNDLLRHYIQEVKLFILNGTEDFLNAVLNESEQPFLTYLNIVIQAPSEDYPSGKTVRDSIVEQIS